jgi:hypothetical protein
MTPIKLESFPFLKAFPIISWRQSKFLRPQGLTVDCVVPNIRRTRHRQSEFPDPSGRLSGILFLPAIKGLIRLHRSQISLKDHIPSQANKFLKDQNKSNGRPLIQYQNFVLTMALVFKSQTRLMRGSIATFSRDCLPIEQMESMTKE